MTAHPAFQTTFNQDIVFVAKQKLTQAFHLFAMLGMDDLTYTHLSVRHPQISNHYFINPLGPIFEEMHEDMLLEVDLEGNLIGNPKGNYNPTGDCIHKAIYKARPEVNAIMHLHTIDGVAVSTLACGLLPISQFALHFYNNIAYHDYNGLVLDALESKQLSKDLKHHNALILRNHGLLTIGKTIEETFFLMYYLDQAAKTQVKALSMNKDLQVPTDDICLKASQQMRQFEPNLGSRDWDALIRKLKRSKQ